MTGILNIQMSPSTGEKKNNLDKVEYYIKKHSDKQIDLVVVPEFFSTGISDKAFKGCPEDENGGVVVEFLSGIASKYNTNIICGSVIEKVEDKYYNTSFALNRAGEIIGKYRKIHLFSYMGGNEGNLITSGDKYVVADMDFGKVGMAVCFDIRYPQMFRSLTQMGAEIIVLPTAWAIPNEVYNDVNTRNYAKDMWFAMNRTRAYDNMVYMVISDLCGNIDKRISCLGCSMIISPTAEVLASAQYDEGAIYSDVDLRTVKFLKSQYPIANID